MNWIIRSIEQPDLCWSNEDGWVQDTFDTFSEEEKNSLSLPIGGEWEQVPWSIAS